ncbi:MULTISPECIES: TetR/AcrR family transcriptional regulator [unclassified Nocardia]|uniref:TetR/AcrR family transcriptional regulator n=1 Tax=unclassified Nocardia TaxID=2637762 RepID=UPI001CE48AD6|nr:MULTISPECIES: TetR/AcrR family transcriptional regulator [unclassified Nocardia]
MRRAEITEKNRKALIEAAIADIAEHGYQAARLGALAERAGLTTGAVYSIFGSKRALLVAATRQLVTEFHATLEPLADPALSLTEVLRGYAAAMLGHTGTSRARKRFTFELESLTAALRDDELRAELESQSPQAIPALTRLLTDRVIDSGATPTDAHTTPEQAARLAAAVQALLSGFAQHCIVTRSEIDHDYAAESAVALTALID